LLDSFRTVLENHLLLSQREREKKKRTKKRKRRGEEV
jgi:hypothetical protein